MIGKDLICQMPARQIPAMRYKIAMDAGVKQIIMTTCGGLGDQVCAEPTLRYAFKLFPDYEISLMTSFPDLFTHLPFKNVFTQAEAGALNEDEWLVLHTNTPPGNLAIDFLTHAFTHAVDFCSLCALQRQLPIIDRQIYLESESTFWHHDWVIVHPGRNWQSKTFPSHWWNNVITALIADGRKVVVVGKDVDPSIGTVDVDTTGCIDLRNQLSIKQLIQVLKKAAVVVTNDSAPLHIAAAGKAKILFIASCKEADHLMHWRNGQLGWGMQNLGLDGLWNHQSSSPIRSEPLSIDKMPEELLLRCLPSPQFVADSVSYALSETGLY